MPSLVDGLPRLSVKLRQQQGNGYAESRLLKGAIDNGAGQIFVVPEDLLIASGFQASGSAMTAATGGGPVDQPAYKVDLLLWCDCLRRFYCRIQKEYYRRFGWALTLLKAIKSTYPPNEDLKIVTYGH
jgi:hypothetical protein